MNQSPNNPASKAQLREQALSLRATLPMETISRAVCGHLAEWEGFRQAEEILFYFPFRHEVDLRSLYYHSLETARDNMAARTKTWYLPAVLSSHEMVFRLVPPDFEVQDGKYGIPVPPENAKRWFKSEKRSLLLVPGVLFDANGYRLGYGKGYYDRFLSVLLNTSPAKETAIPRVGIVPEALLHPGLPYDQWDIPMDFLVTEQGVQPTGIERGLSVAFQDEDG